MCLGLLVQLLPQLHTLKEYKTGALSRRIVRALNRMSRRLTTRCDIEHCAAKSVRSRKQA